MRSGAFACAALIRLAVATATGRVPVVAGCGGPSTEAAASLASLAAKSGADALLCAPTAYVKLSQDGIVAPSYGRAYSALIPGAHFAAIDEAGHHPEMEQPEAFADQVLGFLEG